jgi:hypothetical protein
VEGPAEGLSPKAREVYAALAEPGTEADVVARTGLNPKTVGPRIGQDLIKRGLVEVVGQAVNERGRKVSLYARVPIERIEEARARARGRLRVKPPRQRSLDLRKRMVKELFKDKDLLEALVADKETDRARARARKAAREELRVREREAAELRRAEKRAAETEDPRLPFWRAQRAFTEGADAGRILKMMLDREIQLAQTRGQVLIDAHHWSDVIRHTTDALEVTGALHLLLHEIFDLPRTSCPACGADPAPEAEVWDVIEAQEFEELAELASSDE